LVEEVGRGPREGFNPALEVSEVFTGD